MPELHVVVLIVAVASPSSNEDTLMLLETAIRLHG
jgi:hypothetical protein